MVFFVTENSIVKRIWGRGDMVLLIFAGASAEFALNKAVDWLYFTGRLPADPLGRLFSTVSYAQKIVFAEYDKALASIDSIVSIHRGVEQQRAASIPDGAYLDVLFLLIDYSIRSFELLDRKLSLAEKAEVFDVFHRVGARMGLRDLPGHFGEWETRREHLLRENLVYSPFTRDLYGRYRKNLGSFRYWLLLHAQVLLLPSPVRPLLPLPDFPLLWPAVQGYKLIRLLRLDRGLRAILLPRTYRDSVASLDINSVASLDIKKSVIS